MINQRDGAFNDADRLQISFDKRQKGPSWEVIISLCVPEAKDGGRLRGQSQRLAAGVWKNVASRQTEGWTKRREIHFLRKYSLHVRAFYKLCYEAH